MKISRKASRRIAFAYLLFCFAMFMIQPILLTMKCTGDISWNWWAVFSPVILVIVLPMAIFVGVILALIPRELLKVWKTARRVDADAKKYGMERQPGESVGDLKKRVICRNMLSGDYSRKEVKDMILEAFPMVGSCQILVSNDTKEVVLIPRSASIEWSSARFADDELREIAEFAAQYIPIGYTVTARNAYTQEVETYDNKKTDGNA